MLKDGIGVYKVERVGKQIQVEMNVRNLAEAKWQVYGVLVRVHQYQKEAGDYSTVRVDMLLPNGNLHGPFTYSRRTIEAEKWMDDPEKIYLFVIENE